MRDMCMANPGKVAIISGCMLTEIRPERVYSYPHVRMFLNEHSAREWLFNDRADMGRIDGAF